MPQLLFAAIAHLERRPQIALTQGGRLVPHGEKAVGMRVEPRIRVFFYAVGRRGSEGTAPQWREVESVG